MLRRDPCIIVTKGIISNCNREFEGIKYLQTDTTINPGNSRGPLINSMGEVIGVTTFMLSNKEGSGSIGINFALTISAVKDFMDDRLNPPENSLQKEGEERSKRFKEHRKYLASVFDKKYWEEYRIFLARVYYLNRGGVITGDQTRSLMDRPLKPPAGFNSIV